MYTSYIYIYIHIIIYIYINARILCDTNRFGNSTVNRTGPGAQHNPPAIAATWWVTRGSLKWMV